jgi:hypothetical protein
MSEDTEALRDILTRHASDPWDADTTLGPTVAWGSPPGLLVAAVLRAVASPSEVLAFLTLAVAKRSLACWELYCDRDDPIRAVEAAERAIRFGGPVPTEQLEEPAEPTFGGVPIVDCRACDTGSASDAVAHLVRFVRRRDPLDAIFCLSAAEIAFDQSPLGERDDFHRWLRDVALPAAVERRPLSSDEESAYRQYSSQEIRDARKRKHDARAVEQGTGPDGRGPA